MGSGRFTSELWFGPSSPPTSKTTKKAAKEEVLGTDIRVRASKSWSSRREIPLPLGSVLLFLGGLILPPDFGHMSACQKLQKWVVYEGRHL